jgi:hypothetical protein
MHAMQLPSGKPVLDRLRVKAELEQLVTSDDSMVLPGKVPDGPHGWALW